jgi:transcriptional regulator with XRE-family HTH domain
MNIAERDMPTSNPTPTPSPAQLTQQQIAERVGTSQSVISEAFRAGGERLGRTTAKKIAKVVGRPWPEVLAMSGPEIEEAVRAALEPPDRAA